MLFILNLLLTTLSLRVDILFYFIVLYTWESPFDVKNCKMGHPDFQKNAYSSVRYRVLYYGVGCWSVQTQWDVASWGFGHRVLGVHVRATAPPTLQRVVPAHTHTTRHQHGINMTLTFLVCRVHWEPYAAIDVHINMTSASDNSHFDSGFP